MMSDNPASHPSDDDMREATLVHQGLTVSSRGSCMTRIGKNYVLRDADLHCVRLPVATTDTMMLGAAWADFSRTADATGVTSITDAATWSGSICPKDVGLVLQGYTVTAPGVCLARVVGNYVTRDGHRRRIRCLTDTVDPVALGAAWAAFSDAAGWVGVEPARRAETVSQPIDRWVDDVERRRASG
jgi:hypothetical protein